MNSSIHTYTYCILICTHTPTHLYTLHLHMHTHIYTLNLHMHTHTYAHCISICTHTPIHITSSYAHIFLSSSCCCLQPSIDCRQEKKWYRKTSYWKTWRYDIFGHNSQLGVKEVFNVEFLRFYNKYFRMRASPTKLRCSYRYKKSGEEERGKERKRDRKKERETICYLAVNLCRFLVQRLHCRFGRF